jgi:nitrite reductase/ring-hydroxylating ferredoxin subunit
VLDINPQRAWYLEGEPFQHERRTVFARSWLMLGRAEAVPAYGDYLSLNLAGWPVLAVRGDDGAVRAFRNTCRHQSMLVVDKASGQSDGLLRCRYHGWAYDTRGRFKDAPQQYLPTDPASPEHGLVEIGLSEWRGLIFIRIAATGAAFAPVQAPADWPFAHANSIRFASELSTDFACNWKVLVEHIVATTDARSGADRAVRWQWPNLVVESGPGEMIVHQIVPRSFSRTRVITHFFFSPTANAAARISAVKAEVEADQAQCQRTQAELEVAGALSAASEGSAVARFRAAVVLEHGSPPADDPLPKPTT